MTKPRTLTPLSFLLLASVLHPQVKTANQTAQPALSPRPMLEPRLQLRANLLPMGKTQGTFHLAGLVRKDRTVVLRWANDQGEMPTEGVRVFRQKVGEVTWKDLTGSKPLGFLQGKAAEKRLKAMPEEDRDRILSYPFGDVQHDPATRLRVMDLPSPEVVRTRNLPVKPHDLSAQKSLQRFRELRAEGKLNRTDLQLMQVRADMDLGMAEVLGLTYTDDPGKGQWRYKIVVNLPEGGVAEVISPKVFNTLEPTPIPQPVNLSAASGNGEVLLNWDEVPSDAVAGYNIYRAETSGGPWIRLNSDPVKKVELELEDPELTLRKSLGIQQSMERMLRPLPAAARTPQKVLEAHRQAVERIDQPGNLPTLTPRSSKAIKDAVAAGQLRPGGLQAPKSLYTDSRRTAGNALENEKTYQYRVTAVDLGGLEQPPETAPTVPGTPKDLEPPKVPGKPMLKAEMSARQDLRAAQSARLNDARLVAINQNLATRRPQSSVPMTPFQLQSSQVSSTLAPSTGGLSLGEAKRMQLSRTAATMPISALKQLGDATVLHSNADGTVPPANLAWTPSPDADLKGYEVYRATSGGAFNKVADTTAPEWTDTSLEAGQAYRYAICSVDKLGNQSARSPEGLVEVSDSSLPGRLAIAQFTGQITQELPASVPAHRFMRPANQVLASGSLRGIKAPIQQFKTTEPILASFRAPSSAQPIKTKAPFQAAPASKIPLAKALSAGPLGNASALKATVLVKPAFRSIQRSFNPMLMAPSAPKEIHVLLEWAKPVQGLPLEYTLEQAPQKVEVLSVPRPTVAFQEGLRGFEILRNSPAASPLHPVALTPPASTGSSLQSRPGSPTAAPASGLMVATPAMHALALKGLVATQGAGLRLADARLNHMATLQVKGGPGTFTRVNDTPISTERYIVTFPAEAAQYGGATFFFQIQALTKEFGHTVTGPMSAPIEVRLPDIVAPPSPAVGAVDLEESPTGSLDVALSWTQSPASDLKGVLVDRQPMNFTLVDGEPRATTAAGPAERITAAPVAGLTYKDLQAPTGFQRYTLRSVDATGNISEPLGAMDVLVPGEPVPEAPTQLAIAGSRLVWKAAPHAAGYTVWRSFTGQDDDYECISGILGATETGFALPAEGALHLRVVARSVSGMNSTPSQPLVRTP